MVQTGPGKIRLWNDMFGGASLANTQATEPLGDFYAGGNSFSDADGGIEPGDAELSGVINLQSANADTDTSFIGTGISFDVALMGPIFIETRVQIPDVDTKEIFFGITTILTPDEQLQDIVSNSSTSAITITAGLAGFYFSDELSANTPTEWFAIHGGGTASSSTTVADVNLGSDNVATPGEWQVLRLEVLLNGTVRWLIDGVLLQTIVGAVSTSTDYAVVLAAAANSSNSAIVQVDYLLVDANRDWTV